MNASISNITSEHPGDVRSVFADFKIDEPVTEQSLAQAILKYREAFFQKLFNKVNPGATQQEYEKAVNDAIRSALALAGYAVAEDDVDRNADHLGRDTITVLAILVLLILLAFIATRDR